MRGTRARSSCITTHVPSGCVKSSGNTRTSTGGRLASAVWQTPMPKPAPDRRQLREMAVGPVGQTSTAETREQIGDRTQVGRIAIRPDHRAPSGSAIDRGVP